MTGPELQKLIDKLKTTQVGAARELGLDPRTIRRYIAGDLDIPLTVQYAMRWLVHIA